MDDKQNSVPRQDDAAGKKSILKKTVRLLLWVTGIIIVLIVAALSCLVIFIEPAVKGVIENFGPEIAGVRFELEDISIKPFNGHVAIKNLTVYNPDGYDSEYALKLGDVALQTELLSWLPGRKSIIREIRLREITLNYETDLPLSENSNLNDILKHIKKSIPAKPDAAQSVAKPKVKTVNKPVSQPDAKPETVAQKSPAPEKNPRRFQLDKLTVENVRAVVIPRHAPQFKAPVTVTLPEIEPLGTDEKGLTGAELAWAAGSQVATGLTVSILQSGTQIYENLSVQGMKIDESIRKKSREYSGDIKNIVESVKADDLDSALLHGAELLEKAEKDEELKQLGKSLKQLFKKNKRKNK